MPFSVALKNCVPSSHSINHFLTPLIDTPSAGQKIEMLYTLFCLVNFSLFATSKISQTMSVLIMSMHDIIEQVITVIIVTIFNLVL
jgi:hypothetical protein